MTAHDHQASRREWQGPTTTLQRAGFHAVEDDDPGAEPSDAVQQREYDREDAGRD